MLDLTRRDFMKATSAVAAALGLHASGLLGTRRAFGLEAGVDGVPVVWLQGQCCSGCSVSLLNTIHYATADQLLVDTVDMKYHPTLMAGAGDSAQAAALAAYDAGGYVLVVEGAIPTAQRGEYCHLWPGMTALRGIKQFAARADYIIAAGTCACYGGVVGGAPNPTDARGLGAYFAGKPVINIPGCPTHPDWIVGVIAYLMANDTLPALDGYGRPADFFLQKVHRGRCPRFDDYNAGNYAQTLSDDGCLHQLGCRGHDTRADCPVRMWNAGAPAGPGEYGVSWCVSAGSPCYGCTEPSFPDGMAPFYTLSQQAALAPPVDNTADQTPDDKPVEPARRPLGGRRLKRAKPKTAPRPVRRLKSRTSPARRVLSRKE